jgi:hypothetical protein
MIPQTSYSHTKYNPENQIYAVVGAGFIYNVSSRPKPHQKGKSKAKCGNIKRDF